MWPEEPANLKNCPPWLKHYNFVFRNWAKLLTDTVLWPSLLFTDEIGDLEGNKFLLFTLFPFGLLGNEED
jgi:hypothetical protein